MARENSETEFAPRALAAPREAERSLDTLAAWLTAPARSSREAARAIFRWITDRVAYDVRGLPAGRRQRRPPEPEEVLRRRKARCDGFALLFEALAREAGLEAETIVGSSKGYGYAPGRRSGAIAPAAFETEPDHAWNAVRIEGRWELLDATWGAGAFRDGRYTRRFEPHYFGTPPEAFIFDHFPLEARWQLLEREVTRKEFQGLPQAQPAFFRLGLGFEGKPRGLIHADGAAEVALYAPAGVLLHAEVRGGGGRLPKRPLVLATREAERYLLNAEFPRPGEYHLRVFARRADGPRDYHWAVDFLIRARRARIGRVGFPEVFVEFAEAGGRLEQPRTGYLQAGREHPFRLRVPGAEEVAVIGAGKWTRLQNGGESFSGGVTIPRGEITVAAKFPSRRDFSVLLRYTGV